MHDDLYSEITPSYKDDLYLEHHGIKGQKWGIRRYQNEDGSRTSEGLKRERDANYSELRRNSSNINRLKNAKAIGSSERVRQKQKMFENKIKKTGDNNLIFRNTVNDWRRGRIAQLNTKANAREALESYKKNKSYENRSVVMAKYGERFVKNCLLSETATTRGAYNRYRQSGNTVANSVLKTIGKQVVVGSIAPVFA